MTTFNQGVVGAASRAVCQVIRTPQSGLRWINTVVLGTGNGNTNYWTPSFCNSAPSEVEQPPGPPITGGQCPGVQYRVFYTRTAARPNPFPETVSSVGLGPISGATFGCGRPRPGIVSSELAELFIGFADDPIDTDLIVEPGTCISFVRTERVDGLPDDCGNLPSPPIPPFPPQGQTVNVNIDYDTNLGPISIPVDVTVFAPVTVIAPVTTILAPVRIVGPNFNLTGNLQLSPTVQFNVNFGGNPAPGNPVGNPPPENPSTAPPTPEDDDNTRIIGIAVRSQRTGRTTTTELDQINAPTLYVPRLASAYFRVRNRNVLSWAGPFDVKTTSTYIPAPANTFAVDARVSYEEGWSGGFFKIEENIDFGA